ncbi:MAG: MerR family transcriptional regulator [Bacteroidetes bacterium]|nr:MerR family transcriptional regulator [Bacteroidota bacterium]
MEFKTMSEKYITVKKASKILNVNPETLRRWDNRGILKAKRNTVNNYRVYDVEDIMQFKRDMVK